MWAEKINSAGQPTLRKVSALPLAAGHKKIAVSFIETDKELENLLLSCRKGSTKAQEQLYLTYYRFAMSICMRFSRSSDEAREIANDGFFKIMTNLDKYVHGQSFKGWLRKIMVNAAIDYYRRNEKHYHNVDISYVKNESLTPEILSQFNEEFILKAIQELPPSYRLVFNLYVVEGYKHDEIGQILGITAGTSRSNLNIARCKLMKTLTPQYNQKNK